jgi:hypothetical protein
LILAQELSLSQEEAKNRLGYQQWRENLLAHLPALFSAYAVSNEYAPAYATVSNGVGVLCSQPTRSSPTALDPYKVRHATTEALAAAAAVLPQQKIGERYQAIHDRILALADPLAAVSGKDFLLPLMDFHVHSHACKVKRKALRMRLATAGRRDRFQPLSHALSQASKGF